MAIDLANIPYKPFGCINTTIGELCIFSISAGNEEELYQELYKPINECETTIFMRKFVSYICYPKDSLKEGQNKPNKPLLTDEDILSLTDDDLEAIAKLYIENNEYLFKKLAFKKDKNDQGLTVVSPEYSEVEYPKNENENYTQYLLRLNIEKKEKHKRQAEKMFSGINSFSNALENSIKNTLSLGNSLKKTVESIRPVSMANIMPGPPSSKIADILNLERMKEEMRLRPFNDLAERLDQLINASAQAVEFMIEANQIQTRIAGEIKLSSDGTTKYSKRNILLTVVVILLTALGIIFSAYTNFKSDRNNQINRVEDRNNVNLLIENLKKINDSIINNERLKIENEALKSLVDKQEKTIAGMKILIDRQGKRSVRR